MKILHKQIIINWLTLFIIVGTFILTVTPITYAAVKFFGFNL